MQQTVALFGEAEKGEFSHLFFIKSLSQLSEILGNPPAESRGIFFAVQFLLYEQELIYVRVAEEGFSIKDYLRGLQMLQDKTKVSTLAALCLPGVGDVRIIEATQPVCMQHTSFLISTEKDLYDFMTSLNRGIS